MNFGIIILTFDVEDDPFADRWRYAVRRYTQIGPHVGSADPGQVQHVAVLLFHCNVIDLKTKINIDYDKSHVLIVSFQKYLFGRFSKLPRRPARRRVSIYS